MYNLLISLAVGLVVALLVKVAGFSLLAGLIPGLIAFIVAYLLLARRSMAQMQAIMGRVQKEFASQPSTPRELQQTMARAVRMLEEALPLGKWQFLIAPEIHAQLGMLHYMGKDLTRAETHLKKASGRNHMAKAMEGALYFQRKSPAQMKEAFEIAVRTGKKESLNWAVYAWCLLQLKDRDGALKVLSRGVEQNPKDEKLKNALMQVQNDKRLKMRPFEPAWWQFGLEAPPTNFGGGRRVQFMRR